jgi:hypothetical protein
MARNCATRLCYQQRAVQDRAENGIFAGLRKPAQGFATSCNGQSHGSPADMRDLGDHARPASGRSGHLANLQQDDFHRRHRPSVLQGVNRFETSSTSLARPRRSPSRNSFAGRCGGRDETLSMARCRRSAITICERSRLSLQHSPHLRRPGSYGAYISYRSGDST